MFQKLKNKLIQNNNASPEFEI